MKIFACYSPSHQPMLEQHFAPSLPRELEPSYLEIPQVCPGGTFGSPGFYMACHHKIAYLVDILETETEPFIFSDVDIRFYGNVKEDILRHLGTKSIAFQHDGPAGACTGFMAIKPSKEMKNFFRRVLQGIDPNSFDQDSANQLLRICPRWMLLPHSYFTFGQSRNIANKTLWEPGAAIHLPTPLMIHHANWTLGITNKLKLLDTVKQLYDRKIQSTIPPRETS
jgi:hypothetical protein